MRLRNIYLVIGLFFTIISRGQTTLFFQGFEGAASCSENWGFTGGNINTQTARSGASSARVGRSSESNTLLFNQVNIATLSGVQLQLYHSVRSGAGPGMDTREGAAILISLNGAAFTVIGQVGGNADATWSWAASGGTTNTCSQTYTMPNPLNYAVPAGTSTIQVKIISVVGGSNCTTFQTNMTNGTAGNFDRTDEGFFVDDIKLTTTSTAIPGIWTGAANTNWFNCLNWHNNRIPNSQTDVSISQTATNDCIIDAGGIAVCRDISISSTNGTTPDLIIQNASSLSSGGNLNITKSAGTGVCKIEILGSSTFSCNSVTLSGSSPSAGNATFINEYSTNNVTFNGNFNLNSGGELDLTQPGNYGIMNLKGDYNNNALETDFKQTNSIVNLIGTGNQIINTNAFTEVFSNLIVNKVAGTISLSDNISIENQLKIQNGLLDLNAKSIAILTNTPTGILRVAGGIISENTSNSSKLTWQVGTQNGSFLFPFSKADGTYIPLIFNHTSGNAGLVSVATYGTPANNTPLPTTPVNVTNINNASSANNSNATVDRFWEIDVSGNPIADITFNYAASELPGVPYNNANILQAQRYDYLNNVWENYLPGQSAGSYSVYVPSVSSFSSVFTLSNGSSPLPIDLLNFTAKLVEGVVELDWVTMTEINNNYFTIERSSNGLEYNSIATISGAGNSSQPTVYQFIDIKPLYGISYYRLKQTDFDATNSYSQVAAIKNLIEAEITLYPNPASNFVNISQSVLTSEKLRVDVFNSDGQQLDSFTFDSSSIEQYFTIDFTAYPAGIYLLKISSGNTTKFKQLVLKK